MKSGSHLAAVAAVLLAGCAGMKAFDATPRTKAPHNDRFAKAWCEAQERDGTLLACGSAPPPLVHPGQSCECHDSDGATMILGRIVGLDY